MSVASESMASLVADYGDSGESSNESSSTDNDEPSEEQTSTESRLPPPAFADKVKNSVFVNPYLEAENAKIAVLEKHVKMVPIEKPKVGSENKVCWMFKKGSCRYGKKCKFKHILAATDGVDDVLAEAPSAGGMRHRVGVKESDSGNGPLEDDEEPKRKKKRPGLTQGLIPGKRVVKMYKKQKESA